MKFMQTTIEKINYQKRFPRRYAIKGKKLIDVTSYAEKNDFYVSLCITEALNNLLKNNIPTITNGMRLDCNDLPLHIINQGYEERLNDLLWTSNMERSKDENKGKSIINYSVFMPHYEMRPNKNNVLGRRLKATIKVSLVYSKGDFGELVITIMLKEEPYKWLDKEPEPLMA